MLRTNLKFENFFNYSLKLLLIIFIFFSNINNVVYGVNNNWIEVSKMTSGIQYLDKDSLISKGKGVIEITTKYIKIDSNTSKKVEENIYIMKINCLTNEFKDVSVNGKKTLNAKWQDANGDKLIIDVISESCKNVKIF